MIGYLTYEQLNQESERKLSLYLSKLFEPKYCSLVMDNSSEMFIVILPY